MSKNTAKLDSEIASVFDSRVFECKQIILSSKYQNDRSYNLRKESGNFKERLGIPVQIKIRKIL